jgi:hypothetical protein
VDQGVTVICAGGGGMACIGCACVEPSPCEVSPHDESTANTAQTGAQMLFETLSLMAFSPALKG